MMRYSTCSQWSSWSTGVPWSVYAAVDTSSETAPGGDQRTTSCKKSRRETVGVWAIACADLVSRASLEWCLSRVRMGKCRSDNSDSVGSHNRGVHWKRHSGFSPCLRLWCRCHRWRARWCQEFLLYGWLHQQRYSLVIITSSTGLQSYHHYLINRNTLLSSLPDEQGYSLIIITSSTGLQPYHHYLINRDTALSSLPHQQGYSLIITSSAGIQPYHHYLINRATVLSSLPDQQEYSLIIITSSTGIQPYHHYLINRGYSLIIIASSAGLQSYHYLISRDTALSSLPHQQGYSLIIIISSAGIQPYYHYLISRDTVLSSLSHQQGYSLIIITSSAGLQPYHHYLISRATALLSLPHQQGYSLIIITSSAGIQPYHHCLISRATVLSLPHQQGYSLIIIISSAGLQSYYHYLIRNATVLLSLSLNLFVGIHCRISRTQPRPPLAQWHQQQPSRRPTGKVSIIRMKLHSEAMWLNFYVRTVRHVDA